MAGARFEYFQGRLLICFTCGWCCDMNIEEGNDQIGICCIDLLAWQVSFLYWTA
jgi:hypothetical protein